MSRAAWPALAAVLASIPVLGAFSTTNVFHVRDLGLYFWPRHVWFRRSVLGGDWPLWDRFTAAGQSAVADALNQFFLLPVTLVRLVLPDVAGFNFWVAAPFPLMAVGAWLWLRRHASAPAAFVGAAILAASGPVVSTGNFPNLSWTVACIPWILWSAERLAERRSAGWLTLTAAFVGLQALSGEPVTFAATAALVVAATRSVRVAAAVVAGALLSAIQTVPLAAAAAGSPRAGSIDSLFWSLHPYELSEMLVLHLFGHWYDTVLDGLPWIVAMHDREPLFFSIYVGVGAVVLASVYPADRGSRRRWWFWAVVGAIALLCALGKYTPVYPALQAVVPPLQSFRFPIKYLVFCMVALAALAASGADALLGHARGRGTMSRPTVPLAIGLGVAAIGGIAAVVTVMSPESALWFWEGAARLIDAEEPGEAARWLVGPSVALFGGVAALGGGAAVLVAAVWTRHRRAHLLAIVMCGLAVVDPVVANRDLQPTMPATGLGPPGWTAAVPAHAEARVYVGGRVSRVSPRLPPRQVLDAADEYDLPADSPTQDALTRLSAHFAYVPAAWGVREAISYDLPRLWPREYSMMLEIFGAASREERLRFVRRSGVRYCYLSEPPVAGVEPVFPRRPLTGPMALYECGRDTTRVYMTPEVRIVPDVRAQLELMFDEAHDPRRTVLLSSDAPAPAGRPGDAAEVPDARIVHEHNVELVVQASVGPDGGYLTVLDSYDPWWRVEVDDAPATLLRANGLYRAVRLAPGEHEVRFTYRPMAFYAGMLVTLLTAAALGIACLRERVECRRIRQAVTA